MCLIILANDLKSLNYKDLETAYKRNSDGFGVMYLDNKKNFVSDKFVPKNFNEVKNFFNYHKKKLIKWQCILDLKLKENKKKIVTLL